MAELADAQDLGSCEEIRVGSTPTTRTKMNDPTQSEQIVVSCSDWVGLFFACSPCVSRVTGFFGLGYHMSLTRNKQLKIREQNV